MTGTVKAALLMGPGHMEMGELQRPTIRHDDALLRVEGCGICGFDLEQYHATAHRTWMYPMVPGHEVVGRIEEIGPEAQRRWGVTPGDRIAVEPGFPCGRCSGCREQGRLGSCTDGSIGGPLRAYSQIPIETAPGLWGGYAELMYLHPDTRLHRVDENIPIELATLFNPLANAFHWAVMSPHLTLGEDLLVLGAGQRGLACIAAARAAGAARITVTGLASDERRLRIAQELGADHTIVVDETRLSEALAALDFEPDVVVDATAGATQPLVDAIECVRIGGRVVLAGLKDGRPIPGFVSDRVVFKELTMLGVRSASRPAFAAALRLLAADAERFRPMHDMALPLEEAERAVLAIGGGDGREVLGVLIQPNIS